jgi:hypothetical protein
VLDELSRFFANALGINAIVRRSWLARVAMPLPFAMRSVCGTPGKSMREQIKRAFE